MTRRMFSDEITTTDAFLDMPGGSQLLYFHLGMEADDDGFISSPKMVMRAIGSSDDELKILYAKKFLIQFESGICVIKHWRINNYIRKDIYKETKYTRERDQLLIKENGAYTLNTDTGVNLPKGHFILKKGNENNDEITSTLRARDVHLGKVRLGKVSKDMLTLGFEIFWQNYPRKVGRKKALEAWLKIQPDEELAKRIITGLLSAMQSKQWKKDNGQFIPHPSTWLNQERWNDECEPVALLKIGPSKFDKLKITHI